MGPGPFWIENWKTNKIHLSRVKDWFKKKLWIGGWVGAVSSKLIFLDVWNFFNFARPLNKIV